jgi:CubicO group peptidase (beta-lactamase class C family)
LKYTKLILSTSLFLTPSFIHINSRGDSSLLDPKYVGQSKDSEEKYFKQIKSELYRLEQAMTALAKSSVARNYIGSANISIHYNDRIAFEINEGSHSKTAYSLASVTKPITSFAILQLIEYEELKLSATINELLPELSSQFPAFNGKRITVKNLLQHTSGIPYIGTRPVCAPGSRFMYSNYNYKLLAMIIERVSGQSYASFIRENVFKPLEMNDSKVAASADGASGIMASNSDLAKFASVFVNEGRYGEEIYLTTDIIKKVFRLPVHIARSNYMEYYGLGWRVTAIDSKVKHFYHKGIWDGIFAEISVFPKNKSYIVQLASPPSYKAAGFSSYQGQMSYLTNKYIETLEKLPKKYENYLSNRYSVTEELSEN